MNWLVSQFPPEFLEFLLQAGIPLSSYDSPDPTRPLPRYVRICAAPPVGPDPRRSPNLATPADPSPNADSEAVLESLTAAFGQGRVQTVACVPGFVRIAPCDSAQGVDHVRVAQSQAYREKRVLGIDISSGVAVDCLQISTDDHVLDLCCAPGSKLLYIAEKLSTGRAASKMDADVRGSVTGVDVNLNRLYNARSLARKYGAPRVRLFHACGVHFQQATASNETNQNRSLEPDGKNPGCGCTLPIILATSSKPLYTTRVLRQHPSLPQNLLPAHISLYDKVLVDAECTHDGSIIHIIKYIQKGDWGPFINSGLNQNRLKRIPHLQRGLIENGFRLLKPNGLLVYSTCSFSRAQNEDIVQWLLDKCPSARIDPIDVDKYAELSPRMGMIEGTLRTGPWGNASGFFVSRIRKVVEKEEE